MKSATVSSAAKPASAAKTAAAKSTIAVPAEPAGSKGRIYLIDAMSFIFRAYHAMARQRPMSTKTGIPTSATYVFVNMLRKLRADFSPQYLAAVFDVSAPTFRDQQATEITSLRKFDSKTQTYVDVAYDGYKANRVAMPPDLAQQVPYIRRALDAYRIPILEMPGFEADDVIGTLAQKAADEGYSVFVVSSDKDMMQLVSDRICVLNPPKDNLICDAAKVEEILGVPPERVVDVMALRGDSIDNIPGAPGIGDKGSVELIQRFGSVEGALDHADEVERKTYRESLQNNRDAILVSKKLVTIDRNVAVDFDPRDDAGAGARRCCRARAVHRARVQHPGAGLPQREHRTRRDRLPRSQNRGRSEGGDRCGQQAGKDAGDRAGIFRCCCCAGRDGRHRRSRERAALADRRGSASDRARRHPASRDLRRSRQGAVARAG